MYRMEIKIGGGSYTNYTDDLMNWEAIDLSYKRSGLTGIVRTFSSAFQLSGDAFTAVFTAWKNNGVDATATLRYSTMAADFTYTTLFECALDFSTFTYNRTSCSINAIDNSLASVIKANAGTKYQWAVSDFTTKTLKYTHLTMQNRVNFQFVGTSDSDETYTYLLTSTKEANTACYTIPKHQYTSSEIAVKGTCEYFDVDREHGVTQNIELKVKPFFTMTKIGGSSVTVRMRFNADAPYGTYASDVTLSQLVLGLLGDDGNGNPTLTALETTDIISGATLNTENTYTMQEGESLCLYILCQASSETSWYTPITNFEELSVTYNARSQAVVERKVVAPTAVMQKLLDKMCGSGVAVAAISDAPTRLQHTYLLAAEAARDISGAQLYTSWADFCAMMEAQFGYVPVIDNDNSLVTMVHRDTLFGNTSIKSLTDVTDMEAAVASDMIVSSVLVGYKQVEYDSVNGRDEWRWTCEYETRHTLTDNTLELICPYRGDAYGIEFLVNKTGEATTDSDSDEDLFLVSCTADTDEPSKLKLWRNIAVANVIDATWMFNVTYSQRYMIDANSKYLASYAANLDFASMGGNSSVRVASLPVKSDFSLASPLIKLATVTVRTAETAIPATLDGYVEFTHGGLSYRGYIKDVSYHEGHDKAVQYTLYLSYLV